MSSLTITSFEPTIAIEIFRPSSKPHSSEPDRDIANSRPQPRIMAASRASRKKCALLSISCSHMDAAGDKHTAFDLIFINYISL